MIPPERHSVNVGKVKIKLKVSNYFTVIQIFTALLSLTKSLVSFIISS